MSYQYLEWDSKHFGKRIGRMTNVSGSAPEEEFDCLYFLASNRSEAWQAERLGFHFMDMRVTLSCLDLSTATVKLYLKQNYPYVIRAADPEDLPILRNMAIFNHSRFYQDPHFDPDDVDEMFKIWVDKSVSGELADTVRVAEMDDKPVGYQTVKGNEITLHAVDPNYRRRGISSALTQHTILNLHWQGYDSVSVVTQGSNMGMMLAYQKCGLMVTNIQMWYHKWFTHEGSV